MYAYEIEGWLTGVKIRRAIWDQGAYMRFVTGKFIDESGYNLQYIHSDLFKINDWELYTEKKEPRKEKIKQYRSVLQFADGSVDSFGIWSSNKPQAIAYNTKLVAIEEREIEIYPDGIEEK